MQAAKNAVRYSSYYPIDATDEEMQSERPSCVVAALQFRHDAGKHKLNNGIQHHEKTLK